MRSLLAAAAISTTAILFSAVGAAQAGPASPGTAAAAQVPAVAPEAVRWVCGPYRCVWQPGARVWIPPYARGWGPPRRVGCYWSRVRGPGGNWRWVQICR